MKKSLIAMAVAGVVSAPAFAATSNVDVYGRLSVAVEKHNGCQGGDCDDASSQGLEVVDRVSFLGFKGSEDLGGGMKAVWQIETQLNLATNEARYGSIGYTSGRSGTTAFRNTYVGLSGGFGTVLAGRHDTPYKLGTTRLDMFADTMADVNGMVDGVALVDAAQDHRSPQAIAYISPTWSGFHVGVAAVATNTSVNLDTSNKNFDALSATGIYENGPLFASLSYQSINLSDLGAGIDDSRAWKAGVGYSFGNVKLGGVYERIKDAPVYTSSGEGYYPNCCNFVTSWVDGESDRNSWYISAAYTMGNIVLKGQYGRVDLKGSDAAGLGDVTARDMKAWAIGADYNLSKRSNVYALYTRGDNENDTANSNDGDVGGFAIGVRHTF